MKTLSYLVVAVVGMVVSSITLRAYERLQGPTEVTYWDKIQTYNGYTFFGVRSNTYLIDMEGRVAHTWPVGTNPHLLTNGNVLDAFSGDVNGFAGLKEVDWSGNTVWQYTETRTNYSPHHDFLRIFNAKLGTNTTLYIAAKSVTSNQCVAAGCNPSNSAYTNAQVDAVVEVDMAGNVIWEWCFFDHGIQDFDASKSNYVGAGKSISNYPGRLNLNLPGRPVTNDWLHCNAIDYNTNLDQIVITAAGGEFYVIDHGNTFVAGNPAASIALAATTNGDFLYRFGDPARYSQGSPASVAPNWTVSTTGNKQIGAACDAQWIPGGLPGAGHFLVFNNGGDLFETTPQSYIFEINGNLNASGNDTGNYVNPPAAGYYTWSAPGHDTDKQKKSMSSQITWMYYSMANQGMFSHLDSGIQRLPNGNTLICDSTEGHVFEVTSNGVAVWEYINPVTADGITTYKRDNWPTYNSVFRAYRFATNHPALAGHALTPQSTITGSQPSYISSPTISSIIINPLSPTVTNSVWITALVTNVGSVAAVNLTYIVGSTTNTVSMSDDGLHQDGLSGDGCYGARISAMPAGTLVQFYLSALDAFDNAAMNPVGAPASLLSYTVQGGPVISGVTNSLGLAGHPVWVTAGVQAAVSVASVTLSYTTGLNQSLTNTPFIETMATNAVKPWTGSGCINAWTVTPSSGSPFEQAANANYGSGNTNGLSFKNGTTNVSDSMITTTKGIDARGSSGTLGFYIQTSISSSNAGWAMQLNPGTGFTTRLSGQTSTSQSWQFYSYSLQPGDLVSNLFLRFQFSEGSTANRVFLDQITLTTVSATGSWTNVLMYDDGLHDDGASSDGTYGGLIPAFSSGTTVSYYLTATDAVGLSTSSPADAPTSLYSYSVTPNINASPIVTGTISGSNPLLQWSAQPGCVYTVQWSDDLITWTNSFVAGQTNIWIDTSPTITMPKRFYRLLW